MKKTRSEPRRGLLKALPGALHRFLCTGSLIRRCFRLFLLVCLVFALDVGRYAVWPRVSPLAETPPSSSSFMEYRREQWDKAGKKEHLVYRWVDWGRISPHLRLAVTIAEDDKFWDHEGFDFESMEEAVITNTRKGRFSAGGSTITQQLAKNLWFTPEKSLLRKLKEAVMAWRLEHSLEKERILEIYLNVAEWGDGIFGAEAAARRYFNRSAANLTPQQAATLAAMLPAPLRRGPDSRIVRKKASVILQRMARRGGA